MLTCTRRGRSPPSSDRTRTSRRRFPSTICAADTAAPLVGDSTRDTGRRIRGRDLSSRRRAFRRCSPYSPSSRSPLSAQPHSSSLLTPPVKIESSWNPPEEPPASPQSESESCARLRFFGVALLLAPALFAAFPADLLSDFPFVRFLPAAATGSVEPLSVAGAAFAGPSAAAGVDASPGLARSFASVDALSRRLGAACRAARAWINASVMGRIPCAWSRHRRLLSSEFACAKTVDSHVAAEVPSSKRSNGVLVTHKQCCRP
jgi:hypothetical protein